MLGADGRRRRGRGVRQGRALPRARLSRRSRDRPARARGRSRGDPRSRARCSTTGYDFSFSGLKTAVVQYVRKHPDVDVADVAASFQAAVVDVLVTKLLRGARRDRASRRWSSAAGSRPTRRCGPGCSTRASRGRAAGRAAEHRAVHRQRGDGRRRRAPTACAADGPTPLEAPARCRISALSEPAGLGTRLAVESRRSLVPLALDPASANRRPRRRPDRRRPDARS